MNVYTAPFVEQAAVNIADIQAAALAVLPSPPDGIWQTAGPNFCVGYNTVVLSGEQQTAFRNAVANATALATAPWAVQAAILTQLTNAISILATMQTQIATLTSANYADYGTANLANLNDLKHKVQQIANGPNQDGTGGLAKVVLGLKNVCRLLASQLDGST